MFFYINLVKDLGVIFVFGGFGKLEILNGYFIELIIFLNILEEVKIIKEEVFGLVVIINIFEIEKEVIVKVNDIEFGLYVLVFIKDISRVMRVV